MIGSVTLATWIQVAMSSMGPQLPPQTTKRKRVTEEESADSPAAKLRITEKASTNQDEIDLSSDEDDYGPSVPKPKATTSIGPTLPPSNADEIKLDESDDDGIGPSAPPPPASTRPSIGPSTNQDEIPLEEDDDGSSDGDVGPAPPPTSGPTPAAAAAKRVLGPAPPPAPLSERPPGSPNSNPDSSDSDDDDYGPALPTSTSHQARATQARARETAERAAAEAAGPQRDDWMLAPPSAGSAYRAPDPTKLKNRRFASGPRSGATSSNTGGGDEVSSIWTETPEQKRQRLENAVLGREGSSTTQKTSSRNPSTNAGVGKTPEDAAQQERIRNFTEATRGKSLYEEHQASRKGRTLKEEEEEDDPSKRAFDREKDMKLGGRIGTAQRRELLNRAADFGGRFEKGKYL
ncbi:hypothetical protein F5Y04DRAFT_257750 [Hypomontagnella monticulosa]|nr:hypothetical protein F5Y04DRAFT_257750 [Hypomontagnella monticulosa]